MQFWNQTKILIQRLRPKPIPGMARDHDHHQDKWWEKNYTVAGKKILRMELCGLGDEEEKNEEVEEEEEQEEDEEEEQEQKEEEEQEEEELT